MIRYGMVLLSFLLASTAWAQNNCLDCHLELEDEVLTPPAEAWEGDAHAEAGLTCASCHGGDPTIDPEGDFELAMDPAKGYIGVPDHQAIPEMCGRCHADAAYMRTYDPNIPVDQLAQYWTSVHGQRVREGDEKVAECASCHGAHGILSTQDPRAPVYPTRIPDTCGQCHASEEYMADYGIPTDQLEQYRTSVHGSALFDEGDLGAPTCNSCHGNHGAAPPGVGSVSLVCGTCHAIQRDLFTQSPHEEAFDAMGLPECEYCHGNHEVPSPSDAMVGVEEGAICLDCHGEGENAYEVAGVLRENLETLKEATAAARQIVERAGRAGMEVSEAEVMLIDANESLVQARNLVHAFAVDPLEQEVEEGLSIASEAEQAGVAALEELEFRRKGLAVSLFFILLVVVGLYLKIRQIEERETSGSPR